MANESVESVELPRARWVDESETSKILGIAKKSLQNQRMLGIGPPYAKFGNGRKCAVRYLSDPDAKHSESVERYALDHVVVHADSVKRVK